MYGGESGARIVVDGLWVGERGACRTWPAHASARFHVVDGAQGHVWRVEFLGPPSFSRRGIE